MEPKRISKFLQILWLTGLSILILPDVCVAMPMFSSKSDESTIVLGKSEEWYAKTTTMITYKKFGEMLVGIAAVKDIYGSEDPPIQSMYLLFKCSSLEATEYNRLLIWSPGNETQPMYFKQTFCSSGIMFQILGAEGPRFTVKIERNAMHPVRCLRDSLEFRMRISVANMFMDSASLFVMNIEPILTMDGGNMIRYKTFSYNPWILSHDAINILTGNHTFHYRRLMKFKFLSNKFVLIFSRSSLLMKSLFAVTVTLSRVPASLAANVSASCTPHPVTPDVLAVFFSGDEYALTQMDRGKPLITGYINPLNGRLLVQNFLKDVLDDKASNARLIICITMRLNTAAWDTGVTRKVMEFIHRPVRHVPGVIQHNSPAVSNGDACLINAEKRRLFLFAGFFSLAIANPVLCGKDTYKAPTNPLIAVMNGRLCKTLWEPHSTRRDLRPKCGRMETYNAMVLFPDRLDAKLHSGSLTFGNGEASFQFSLNVISMPMLNTQTHWSGLTEVSRIRRLRPSTLRCGAFSAHLITPTFDILAHFRIDKRDGVVNDEIPMLFAVKYLELSPNVITTKMTMDDPVRVLEIRFPPLDRWHVEGAVRVCLICRTRVERSDALMMGVSKFESQAYTKLLFTGFPSIDNINAAKNELNSGCCNKLSLKLLAVATSITFFAFSKF